MKTATSSSSAATAKHSSGSTIKEKTSSPTKTISHSSRNREKSTSVATSETNEPTTISSNVTPQDSVIRDKAAEPPIQNISVATQQPLVLTTPASDINVNTFFCNTEDSCPKNLFIILKF